MFKNCVISVVSLVFACASSVACAAPTWSVESQSGTYTALTADDGSLMRMTGASFVEENNASAWGHAANCTLAKLQDGATSGGGGELVTIGDNATYYLKLPNAASVKAVRIYTQGAGRSGIGVTTVYSGKNGTYADLGVAAYSYYDASSKYYHRYTLANTDGSAFATDCDEIKIQFGTMHNNGTIVHEIEVEGEITGGAKTFTVRFLDKDGVLIDGSSQEVEQGADAVPPTAPTVVGYCFVRWEPDYRAIAANTDCRAVYRGENVPAWTVSDWDDASRVAADANLMLQSGAYLEVSAPSPWSTDTISDATRLNDGVVAKAIVGTACGIGSDTTLTCHFAGASDVEKVVIYAFVNGTVNMNKTQITQVEACVDGAFVDVNAEAIEAVPVSADHVQCYVLENAKNAVFAEQATALRLTFGTCAPNSVFLPVEVEVSGTLKEHKTYTVTYLDADGNTLKEETNLEPGSCVTPPVAPVREGFTFLGWDAESFSVVSDLTIRPRYFETGKALPVVGGWTGGWTTSGGNATDIAALPNATNILSETGVTVALENSEPVGVAANRVDPAVLINGVVNANDWCGIGSNGTLVVQLPYAQDVSSILLYTGGNAGLDGFELKSIEYQQPGSSLWNRVNMDADFAAGFGEVADKLRVIISCPDGVSPLMRQATSFRINFGAVENYGLVLSEILAYPHVEARAAWSVSSWDKASSPVELPLRGNLLRQTGASVSFVANYVHDSIYATTNNLAALTDGRLVADIWSGCYPVGRDAVMDLTFNGPKKVSELRFATYFGGAARDLVSVRAIYFRRKGSDTFERYDGVSAYDYAAQPLPEVRGAAVYTLAPTVGECLFENVVQVRVLFDKMANDCCTFAEVEARGSSLGGFLIYFR